MPYPRNYLPITSLLLISACNSPQPDINQKMTDENLYGTTPDDKEMNQAMATARRNFDRSESAYQSGRYDPLKFTIKVRFADPGGNEYIWLTDTRRPRQSRSGFPYKIED